MKQPEAYDHIIKEYLSKCKETGCDGCIAEYYCIENHLRTDRFPQNDCPEKIKKYFQSKRLKEVESVEKDLAEKIYWILIEEGQRNLEKPLGSIITNTPDEVRDIIKKHLAELT
jgi:hypothetical protein